MNTELSPQDNS